jgi:hypothetical protein
VKQAMQHEFRDLSYYTFSNSCSNKRQVQTDMAELPNEILFLIFQYCAAPTTLNTVPYVCHRFNESLIEQYIDAPHLPENASTNAQQFYQRTCSKQNLLWKVVCAKNMPKILILTKDWNYDYRNLYFVSQWDSVEKPTESFYGYEDFIMQTLMEELHEVNVPSMGLDDWFECSYINDITTLSPFNGNSVKLSLHTTFYAHWRGTERTTCNYSSDRYICHVHLLSPVQDLEEETLFLTFHENDDAMKENMRAVHKALCHLGYDTVLDGSYDNWFNMIERFWNLLINGKLCNEYEWYFAGPYRLYFRDFEIYENDFEDELFNKNE